MLESVLGELGDEAIQILLHLGPDVGVDDRGGGSIELWRGGMDQVRKGNHLDLGVLLRDDLADALLVRRIHEREKQHDRDRGHACRLEAPHLNAHLVIVERGQHAALVIEAFFQRQAVAARDELRRRRSARVPDVLSVSAAELDLVATALRDQQAGLRPGQLDHGVVGGRGAVDDQVGLAEKLLYRLIALRGELLDPVHHADRLIGRRGRVLPEREPAVGLDDQEVGERSSDVDPDPVAHPLASRQCS